MGVGGSRLAHPPASNLLQPDGSVLIPAAVAGELLAAAVRDLTARARRDGLLVSARAARVLQALHEAAERHDEDQAATAATSDSGSPPAPTSTVGAAVTVTEAAAQLECSPRWVRYLAETGRIAGRRTGRVWLLDPASLDTYRRHRP
jgi:excisionase family DNA binding protein